MSRGKNTEVESGSIGPPVLGIDVDALSPGRTDRERIRVSIGELLDRDQLDIPARRHSRPWAEQRAPQPVRQQLVAAPLLLGAERTANRLGAQRESLGCEQAGE